MYVRMNIVTVRSDNNTDIKNYAQQVDSRSNNTVNVTVQYLYCTVLDDARYTVCTYTVLLYTCSIYGTYSM